MIVFFTFGNNFNFNAELYRIKDYTENELNIKVKLILLCNFRFLQYIALQKRKGINSLAYWQLQQAAPVNK